MSAWEDVDTDRDILTKRLLVDGGYLYHVIIDGSALGIKHFTSSLCFVPNSTSAIEDALEMVSSSLETVATNLNNVGIELYHHKK